MTVVRGGSAGPPARSAPPPLHTLAVYATCMSMFVRALPSLESIDDRATISAFTASIIKKGPFALSPFALGALRLAFSFTCLATSIAKVRTGVEFKAVRLPGSRLNGGVIKVDSWKTQAFFFTAWCWNLLGFSFLLGGAIPMLVEYEREDILHENPWILRVALISFEVAAPCAFLVSSVVRYALWPMAYREHGASGTIGLKQWISQLQHNGNSLMVLTEVCLMGGLPATLSHAAFAPLFAGTYQGFMWCMANVWSPRHGPVFPYFFMDTTLGARTTMFMVALLAVIGLSFCLFVLLDEGIAFVEKFDGAVANVGCVVVMSSLLMKVRD